MKNVVKKLFKIIEPGDLVRINSNCKNTRKPVYVVYAVVKLQNKTYYTLIGYNKKLNKRFFTKEELILL